MDVVVRTAGDARAALPALREAIWSFDPDIPISAPAAMTDLIRTSEADDRFRALLMWTFAVLATLLASVGVFGVTAHAVRSRARELSIRAALGASGHDVVAYVLASGLKVAVLGALAGLALSLVAVRFVESFLYEVETTDPWVISCARGS